MEGLRIVALCVLAAVVYGVVHDQVTARLCLEYFTIGHARIIASESPTVLAFVWGVVATWWAGLLLGIPLALAARCGTHSLINASQLVRPVIFLLIAMGLIAAAGGAGGYVLADRGDIRLSGWLASQVPNDRHVWFMTALWVHSASYLAGFVGGMGLVGWVIVRRLRAHRCATPPMN